MKFSILTISKWTAQWYLLDSLTAAEQPPQRLTPTTGFILQSHETLTPLPGPSAQTRCSFTNCESEKRLCRGQAGFPSSKGSQRSV